MSDIIAAALGSRPRDFGRVGGGCIHDCRRLRMHDGRNVFVKIGRGDAAELLRAEGEGLACLAPHIRVPQVIAEREEADGTHWMAMEWLDLVGMNDAAWENLGRQLAGLHAVNAESHGLDRDNFIGATPQENTRCASWQEFYIERRLRPQIRLAQSKGYEVPERGILGAAERLLAGHEPRPALLHGDLWGGNCGSPGMGQAIVFDPAPYYGDPETDIAMLNLFGSPPEAFDEGYGAMAEGWEERQRLYELYHILNHLNLFGGTYLASVERCVARMGVR
ncbi:fructosamine kinase family protein [Luteolibacter sp. GHJ8]|uniref:Fructosamine kinase family protein n=1 Tax=Luteolibacter rhizosphaerae TaxID=2989719 RepID=A0ABT3G637_9BACT|nr:fructosamine kinase family protein [Luteolibacter rhizosphaerae]MCW1915306.1 fructosamine kinase family protein [Luteolibacter rhizosphaerae]